MARIADPIDAAAAETELFLETALRHRKDVPQATGFCLNCEEPIEQGRFCDIDCRDDHEKRTRR